MGEFQTVCKLQDLKEGQGKTVAIGQRLIAVFLIDGKASAIDDTCPHMGASLAGGEVENGIVTCPWHGWRFRVSDGTWADNPRVKTGCHEVRIVGDDVQVQIAEKH
jgi:nitrite reductase (NADH) small subunit/3-phenylpropionate/trans-cinnamate dioxygenase ferredoxin subunit